MVTAALSEAEAAFDRQRRRVGLLLSPVVFFALRWAPLPLEPEAHALAAIAALTVVLWVTEAVPLAAAALLIFRQQIPLLYSDNVEVQTLATRLLLFAALYQLSDAWQVATNGILRGFEDTAVPMLFTLLAYWGIGLPVGYILGLTDWWRPAMGPDGFWIGLIAGLSAAAVLLTLRLLYQLRRGKAGATVGDSEAPATRAGH